MIYLCLPEARSGAVFVWFFFSFCCIAVSFIGGSTDRHLVKKNALPPTTANVLSNVLENKKNTRDANGVPHWSFPIQQANLCVLRWRTHWLFAQLFFFSSFVLYRQRNRRAYRRDSG